MRTDQRVPGYLGRILDADGTAVGTCFQVTPGVLVTAWHVLNDLDAGDEGAVVAVDALDGANGSAPAEVVRVDPLHDLAVLRRSAPLRASVPGISATDVVALRTEIVVTGVSVVEDPEHQFRFLDAVGAWTGGTTRDDQVPLGRLSSTSVVPGMSGAPVRRGSDDVVVGVVSARYNSADGWLRDSVWVARIEDLEPLLAGIAEVEVGGRLPLGGAVDLVLTVSETEVRLTGPGLDVTAAHQGVRPRLAEAINDVRRARTRVNGMRGAPVDAAAEEVSLRRVGVLLAESFLPGSISDAITDVLRRAEAEHVPVRVGVVAAQWASLPWETLPDPVLGRPLALHPLVTVYRKLAAQPVAPIPGPLRIVVAISAPDSGGGAVLDYERELRNVLAAVRGARAGDAQVRVVPFASTAAIHTALKEEAAHVLHLSGHGAPGTLVLEDESGAARSVDADTFIDEAIPAGSMPPVISLAACYTDVAAEAGAASFAARLVAHGASVVIGTETSVTDRYATQLFARVYGELVAASVPDVVRAVADARRVVQQQLIDSTVERDRDLALLDEWGVVTVLAGSGSVPVFDPAITAPPVTRGPRSVGGLLARDPGEFVGRRREQRRLPGYLVSAATAGVVLHGIGGVGKTTLAAEITRQVLAHDPARVLADLSGELTVDGIFGAVSAALRHHLLLSGAQGPALQAVEVAGRVDVPWQDRFALLHNYVLDQVPLLLVLDNFEDNLTPGPDIYQVRDDALAELLAQWARSPGRSRLLVTCRYEFTLLDAAEHHLSFRHVGPLSVAETFKLIWSLPALDRLEEPELERVWRMVGGHPRTLEYLDALLRGGAGRYHDVTARLTRAVHTKLGRDAGNQWLATARDLDSALAESLTLAADDVLLDELLRTLSATPQAERLLLGASVYREPVDTNALLFQIGDSDEAAGYTPDRRGADERITQILTAHSIDLDQLSNAAALPPDVLAEIAPHVAELNTLPRPPRATSADLLRLIDRLARTSLLAVDPDEHTVFVHRWTASELERRCHDQGLDEQVHDAHQQAAEYWRWRFVVWPQDRQADVHDLLEARHHLLACGDIEEAGTFTERICSQLYTWGAWDHETTLIHDTLPRLAPDSPHRPGWIHQLGVLAQARGDYEQAERRYQQALQIFERLGDQSGIADSYHQLGILAQDRGDYEQAERRYQQALQIFERLGNQSGTASSQHELGNLAHRRGDHEQAELRYQQALQIFERLGNQSGMAGSYHQLGILAQDREDYEQAERRYQQALQIFERLGNQSGIASSHHELGNLAHRRGDHEQAELRYQQSLQIFERLGNQSGMAGSYHQLGILAQDREDYEQAERRYQQALQIFERLGNQSGIASSYHQLGNLAHRRGDHEQAELRYQQALQINERLGNQSGMANSYHQLGNLATEGQRYADAVVWHIRAFLVRLSLQVPQAAYDVRELAALRGQMGNDAFVDAASAVLDHAQLTQVQAVLDSAHTIDQDESDTE